MTLTYKQLTTLISRFQTACWRLKQAGDYPEEKADKETLYVLIDMKYTAMKKEEEMGDTGSGNDTGLPRKEATS